MKAAANPGRGRPSRAAIEWWVLTVVLLALVLALGHASRVPSSHPVSRLDAAIYDAGLGLWARPPRDDVVVVAIDDDSLMQVGRWPWRRAVLALLVERLQQGAPRAIGIDLLFTEPAPGDDALAEALAGGPAPVVLPVARQHEADGRDLALLPAPRLGARRPLAHVEFAIDADGVIRGLYLAEAGFAAFSSRLVEPPSSLGDAPPPPAAALEAHAWQRAGYVRIGASSAPPRQIAAAALLRGDVEPGVLRGRIVLVGSTARGLGDAHSTTVLADGEQVPGVALHAAAASAMLDGRLVREPPHALRLALFALVLFGVLALLYVTEPRTGLLVVLGTMAATGAGALAALGAGWWLAPGALLVGLALAFPVWGWRRLHAASAGLIEQAARLEMGAAPEPPTRRPIEPISQRLRRLEDAAERIRELNQGLARALATLQAAQREREQTLRFLSHDLRSPHLSILSLLERGADGPLSADDARAIARQSRRALELTDGFMQLARAESQPLRIEPHDAADLAVEAADACWQRAAARGLRIDTRTLRHDAPPCYCDAPLVRRALVNLLDNALRHGPPGSAVELDAERQPDGWRFAVSDRGPGIAAADRVRVFEPWWRGTHPDPGGGAGLGLAFVAAVTERHGGHARAFGRDGGGARIELWLPDGTQTAPPG